MYTMWKNVYLGGMKMGGTKRRWYEKPGILPIQRQ